MAVIKAGYDNKQTHIRVSPALHDNHERVAEVTIEQEGEPRFFIKEMDGEKVWERAHGHSETLAYATLDELLDLRDEINAVIQEIVH
jgi:hypothetical protein